MIALIDYGRAIVLEIARKLLEQGARVRVLSANKWNAGWPKHRNLEVISCDFSNFLQLAHHLAGAERVLVSLHRDLRSPVWAQESQRYGSVVSRAIKLSGIERVVNLSSVGAHLSAETGLILPYHWQEQRLNQIHGLDLVHLRPAFCFERFLRAIPSIHDSGRFCDALHPEIPILCVAACDVVAIACRELQSDVYASKPRVLHLRSQKTHSPVHICKVLTDSVGLSHIKYYRNTQAELERELRIKGLSEEAIKAVVETYEAFYTVTFVSEILSGTTELTRGDVKDFCSTFRMQFQQRSRYVV